jgi:transposase
MSRMEIITRTERRRRWSAEERERILAECDQPDVSVKETAERYDIAESLIYTWRANRRKEQAVASEPLSFISFGEIAAIEVPAAKRTTLAPVVSIPAPEPVPIQSAPAHDLVRPHPGDRPGTIEVALTTGERLVVDSFVNEKALARVLRALRGQA